MRFLVDDDQLTITLALDEEPVDLTTEEIGATILDIAARELYRGAVDETDPSGRSWPAITASTARRKGSALVGVETGAMLAGLQAGWTEVGRSAATWGYPKGPTFGRAKGFHNGRPENHQPPRPLIGWTQTARETAETLVNAAANPEQLPV